MTARFGEINIISALPKVLPIICEVYRKFQAHLKPDGGKSGRKEVLHQAGTMRFAY
jgi:hypothetical protein